MANAAGIVADLVGLCVRTLLFDGTDRFGSPVHGVILLVFGLVVVAAGVTALIAARRDHRRSGETAGT